MIPAKPAARDRDVSLLRHIRLFRRDILSAQPARLYRAWMAEFRAPLLHSFLVNDPAVIRTVLSDRPRDFPKSGRVTEGLRPLLGDAVFVTNGAEWERQRRIIDPAFDGGRLRDIFPALVAAGQAVERRMAPGAQDMEPLASVAAADAIFRALFSVPIETPVARAIHGEFRAYQRAQPILNLGAFGRLPRWIPRLHPRAARRAARSIRALVRGLVQARLADIAAGRAPDDLATRLLTREDPVTGNRFGEDEMVDQVAIFLLAGHETSASALAWSLYLLAHHPGVQDEVAEEGRRFAARPDVSALSGLRRTRDVFREALRLYPPVPMLVREAARDTRFRDRAVPKGAQVVLSPWHLHRHERLWDRPDAFDPDRWRGDDRPRGAYMPFSAGPRVCPGAGFAMAEGCVFLALLVASWRFAPVEGEDPVPVAHLTVRGRDGVRLSADRRV